MIATITILDEGSNRIRIVAVVAVLVGGNMIVEIIVFALVEDVSAY